MFNITALLLAAGGSRRMGEVNKLLMNLGGKPVVRHSIDALKHSRCEHIIAVLGHQAEMVTTVIAGDAEIVIAEDWAQGIGHSLACGIAALERSPQNSKPDGVLVMLGDMPEVTSEHINRLIESFDESSCVVPVNDNHTRWGHPVILPSSLFVDIKRLKGDRGARKLIEAHRQKRVGFTDDAIFRDIDRPEDIG